jgi:hypothetical protein
VTGGLGFGCKLLSWLCRFLKIPVNAKGFISGAAGNVWETGKIAAAPVTKPLVELNRTVLPGYGN